MQGGSLISRRHGFHGPKVSVDYEFEVGLPAKNFSGLHRWLKMTLFMHGNTMVQYAFVHAYGEV
jgi:hypothetical protein